jgi:phosphoribosylanthranilate isomerase
LAASIFGQLPPFVEVVGLFVDHDWHAVRPILRSMPRISCLQWYGKFPEIQLLEGIGFIPTFAVGARDDLVQIVRYLDSCRCVGLMPSAILIDARVPGLHGGTGVQAPWHLLAEFHAAVPLILAGGLTPENVAEAIRIVQPYAVDVASGVESSVGRKDPEKLRRFIENAKAAGGQ